MGPEVLLHKPNTGPSVLASWSLNVWCDLISHDSQSGCVLLVHNVDNRSYYTQRHTLSVGQSVPVVVDMNYVVDGMNSVEVGMNSVVVGMNSVVIGMNYVVVGMNYVPVAHVNCCSIAYLYYLCICYFCNTGVAVGAV